MASHNRMSFIVKQLVQGIKEEEEHKPQILLEPQQMDDAQPLETQETCIPKTESPPVEVSLTGVTETRIQETNPQQLIAQREAAQRYVELNWRLSLGWMTNCFYQRRHRGTCSTGPGIHEIDNRG